MCGDDFLADSETQITTVTYYGIIAIDYNVLQHYYYYLVI